MKSLDTGASRLPASDRLASGTASQSASSADCFGVVRLAVRSTLVYCLLGGQILTSSPAQSSTVGSDKLTEAIVYAGFARKAFRCEDSAGGDSLSAAKRWTEAAISVAGTVPPDDNQRYQRAQQFIRGQKGELAMLLDLEKSRQDLPKRLENALRRGNLKAAESLMPTGRTPPCDVVFQRLQRLLQERRSSFDNLVTEGDKLAATNPSAAASKYASALAIDRDNTAIKEKVRRLRRRGPERK
jgi:hypothetical protein